MFFDNILDEIKNTESKKEKMIKIDYSRNPALNLNYAKSMIINHIDDLSDNELYEFLKKSYSILLKDIFEKDDATYLDILISDRFLTQFIRVINSINLTRSEMIYCNKFAYDYLVREEGDKYIKDLLLSMSKSVNRNMISSLHTVGLPDEIATKVVLSRYSSTKTAINVARLNHLLMMNDANIMTPQMVIYIYEKLFDSFTELWLYTMYDPYDRQTMRDMSSDAGEVYSNISLALCTMLENLDSNVIRKVLLTYTNSHNIKREYSDVRFPIKSLSVSDFRRLLNVVEQLEVNEMMIVP